MKLVEIYQLKDDGSQGVIVTCKLINGEVVCEGDQIFVENLEKEGIFDYSSSGKNKFYPKDGLKFLEQLRFNFKSGYLNASDVKEK